MVRFAVLYGSVQCEKRLRGYAARILLRACVMNAPPAPWGRAAAFAGALLLAAPFAAQAQSAASVTGTVTDTSGAVITGASVTLTNTATNVQQATVTTSAGTYSVINVAPGEYSISASKAGFSTQQLTNVTLGDL